MLRDDPTAPLCGARARSNGGMPCRRLAGANGRCSNHGGKSTGPKTPEGKERHLKSVWKHGYWTREAIAERKFTRDMITQTEQELSS